MTATKLACSTPHCQTKRFLPHVILLAALSLSAIYAWGQKHPIDSTILSGWPNIRTINISPDGTFCAYSTQYDLMARASIIMQPKLTLMTVDGKWKMVFTIGRAKNFQFSDDNKYAVIFLKGDTLALLNLLTRKPRYINDVAQWNLSGNVLAWRKKGAAALYVENLGSKKLLFYNNVKQYGWYAFQKNVLIRLTYEQHEELLQIQTDLRSTRMIWNGNGLKELITDRTGRQFAFRQERADSTQQIWRYQMGDPTPLALLSQKANLGQILLDRFSPDGQNLFLNVTVIERSHNAIKQQNSLPVIWDYKMATLPKQHTAPPDDIQATRTAVLIPGKHSLRFLQNENQRIIILSNNYAVLSNASHTDESEYQDPREMEAKQQATYELVNFNGKRIQLPFTNPPAASPSGKYLVYFDGKLNQYFSYNTRSGMQVNLSSGISTIWKSPEVFKQDNWEQYLTPYNEADDYCWQDSEKALLIHDQYDIWQFDPEGKKAPISLTNGYGEKNNIRFYLSFIKRYKTAGIERIWIPGFHRNSKQVGYYEIGLDRSSDPIVLSENNFAVNMLVPPKAKDKDIWALGIERSTAARNVFTTTNFKQFTQISHERPEAKYNWLSSELHRWKGLDGENIQGILYKPENFDPAKRYPVILYYYEHLSDDLNKYLEPDYSRGPINIPWFVSRDYLVFVPDIHARIGKPLDCAFSAVESAGRYLAQLPFVNPDKMGLQGHSYGAIETNYIITRSRRFRAACSASGIGDYISGYGSILGDGNSMNGLYEIGQNRIGASLWDAPQLYVHNSAIFKINQVTTPILMMHTSNDDVTLLPQAYELFNAFRRMRKKAWLLVYDNDNHALWQKENIIDFTERMTQFFDYYLKDQPAPAWMNELNPENK